MSNKNRIPSDGGGHPKKSPISVSSTPTYDVGDTTVVISMTPTFIGARTPTNFTSTSRRASLSTKISKYSTSAPTNSMFKLTKSKFTSTASNHESIASGASNVVNLGKQPISKIEAALKNKTKPKNFKSVSIDSSRLSYNRDPNLPTRSSNIYVERGLHDNVLKPKDLPNPPRNAPKISLRSSSCLIGKIKKTETPRWIQGVLVKDIGSQTTEPFNRSNFTYSPQPIKINDCAVHEAINEDESYLLSLLETPNSDENEDKRCAGPNAESLLSGKYIDAEELSNPLQYLQLNSVNIDDETVTIRTAKRIIQPTAVRMGSNRQYPKTPLSERSASVHLEDGSSSVSSFSTLVSNITSPDTSKMVKLLISKDMSAFKSLHYGSQTIVPFVQRVQPIKDKRPLQ